MKDSDSKIRLTEDDLNNIEKYFESDRQQLTKEFGYNANADMYLQMFKSFKHQIIENQKISQRVSDQKQYHLLCEGKFNSGSEMAKFHHAMWEELHQIESNI